MNKIWSNDHTLAIKTLSWRIKSKYFCCWSTEVPEVKVKHHYKRCGKLWQCCIVKQKRKHLKAGLKFGFMKVEKMLLERTFDCLFFFPLQHMREAVEREKRLVRWIFHVFPDQHLFTRVLKLAFVSQFDQAKQIRRLFVWFNWSQIVLQLLR